MSAHSTAAGGRGWTRFIGVVAVGLTLGTSAAGAAQESGRAAQVIVGPDGRLTVRALSLLPGAAAARALGRASRDPDASVRRQAARGPGGGG